MIRSGQYVHGSRDDSGNWCEHPILFNGALLPEDFLSSGPRHRLLCDFGYKTIICEYFKITSFQLKSEAGVNQEMHPPKPSQGIRNFAGHSNHHIIAADHRMGRAGPSIRCFWPHPPGEGFLSAKPDCVAPQSPRHRGRKRSGGLAFGVQRIGEGCPGFRQSAEHRSAQSNRCSGKCAH